MTCRLGPPAALLLPLGSFTLLFAAGCASKSVPADRIVYQVSEGEPALLPADVRAQPSPVQRADEATVRSWWDANRPAPGYIPPYETAAAPVVAVEECGDGWGWGPAIGVGLGLGFGGGHDDHGWGISLGLPLYFGGW